MIDQNRYYYKMRDKRKLEYLPGGKDKLATNRRKHKLNTLDMGVNETHV